VERKEKLRNLRNFSMQERENRGEIEGSKQIYEIQKKHEFANKPPWVASWAISCLGGLPSNTKSRPRKTCRCQTV
jgi:hypothetical protein